MKFILMSLLLAFAYSCEKPKKHKKSFHKQIKNSPDTDSDLLNDLEEKLLRSNSKVSNLPSFELFKDQRPLLNLMFLNDKYAAINFQSKLDTSKGNLPLIYKKAISSIYDHFYAHRKEINPPKISDLYSIEVGCLSYYDRLRLSKLSKMSLQELKLFSKSQIAIKPQISVKTIESLSFELSSAFTYKGYKVHYPGGKINYHNLPVHDQIRLKVPSSITNYAPILDLYNDFEKSPLCFYLTLQDLTYIQHQRKVYFNSLIEKIQSVNATIIYYSENRRWTKSVPAKGTIRQMLKDVGIHAGFSQGIPTLFPDKFDLTHNRTPYKRAWYFYAENFKTLDQKLKPGTYILANLSLADFKPFTKPRLEIERNFTLKSKGHISNIKPGDELRFKINTEVRFRLNPPVKKLIRGLKLKKCAEVVGRFDHGICADKWKKKKNSCHYELRPQNTKKGNWHRPKFNFSKSNFELAYGQRRDHVTPKFYLDKTAYTSLTINKWDTTPIGLKISTHSTLVGDNKQQSLHTYSMEETTRNVSKTRVCRKEKHKIIKANTHLEKKLHLNMNQRRW